MGANGSVQSDLAVRNTHTAHDQHFLVCLKLILEVPVVSFVKADWIVQRSAIPFIGRLGRFACPRASLNVERECVVSLADASGVSIRLPIALTKQLTRGVGVGFAVESAIAWMSRGGRRTCVNERSCGIWMSERSITSVAQLPSARQSQWRGDQVGTEKERKFVGEGRALLTLFAGEVDRRWSLERLRTS